MAIPPNALTFGGIYIGPLDNPRERWLTGGHDPAWSPDGGEIAVVKNCQDDDSFCTRLAVVNAATGARVRVPIRNQGVEGPDWSPDGRRLVYLGTGTRTYDGTQPYQVWVMRRDSRQRRRLTNDKQRIREVAWSPDGKWIAFTRVTRSTKRHLRDLWLMRPDGSDKHRLSETFGTCPGSGSRSGSSPTAGVSPPLWPHGRHYITCEVTQAEALSLSHQSG